MSKAKTEESRLKSRLQTIITLHQRITDRANKDTAKDAWRTGEQLDEARYTVCEMLCLKWKKWAIKNLPFSPGTADDYMRIFREKKIDEISGPFTKVLNGIRVKRKEKKDLGLLLLAGLDRYIEEKVEKAIKRKQR